MATGAGGASATLRPGGGRVFAARPAAGRKEQR